MPKIIQAFAHNEDLYAVGDDGNLYHQIYAAEGLKEWKQLPALPVPPISIHDQVLTAAVAVKNQIGRNSALAIVQEFGVKSVNDLPAAHYEAFIAKCKMAIQAATKPDI